jgi:diguanylate cyclase (GGDEF)-like protein
MFRLAAAKSLLRLAAADGGAPSRPDPDPELLALRVEVQRLRLALALSRAREQRNRHLAQHDALTGLPNRQDFDKQSFRAIARHDSGGHAFALLYIDLDGFKTINERYGHDIGDELLMVIGARLSHAVRKGDSVSRHGSDEFACLLPDVANEAHAMAIARKVHGAIAAPSQIGPLAISIGPSIGVALYPRDAQTVATLLQAANQAMRWAKQERLSQAFFSRMPQPVRTPRAQTPAGSARPIAVSPGSWAGPPAPVRAASAARPPGSG